MPSYIHVHQFIYCLFDIFLFNAVINSYGHADTLPPFYTFGMSRHPEYFKNITILVYN